MDSIQLFRETLSEKSAKLHKPILKGSVGRRIELLHVLNTYILLDVLLCSIAEYFYELCRILTSP